MSEAAAENPLPEGAPAPEAAPKKPPNRRRAVPTILQMEAVECGAASLAMVMSYFGKIVPLEELRHACGVSRDGSKAINIVKAAKKFGLDAKGFKYETEDLYEQNFPVILHWNANHFVVLEGFKKDKVFINDPAQGPRVLTHDELDVSFTGVVLTFGKGPDFVPGGERTRLAPALLKRLQGSMVAVLFILLCGLLLVAPGLVTPAFSRVFVDEYLIAGRSSIVQPLLLGMIFAACLTMFLTWLQKYFLLRLETRLALNTSGKFFQHVLRLPVGYFAQRFAGEIGARVAINDKVATLVTGRLASTAIDLLLIFFYAGLMFWYDLELTLLVLFLSGLNVLAMQWVKKIRKEGSQRLQTDKGKLTGTAMSGLKMMETLKATGGELEFFARWSGYQAKALRAEQQLRAVSDLVSSVPTLVNSLITASVLLLGGFKVIGGELTVGFLVAYQSLTGFFIRPLTNFVNFGSALQELEADLTRLDDVLRYPQDPIYDQEAAAGNAPQRTLKLQGRVELKNITFGYSPLEKPLVEDFSIVVEPGQRVAFVGASGSGKSTAARLISGLYQPWSGEILFDGVPRQKVPRRLLSNSIAMVDQEVFLFAGTVRENVCMWDSTIPAERVITACRDGAISDEIERREGTYQSILGEGGGNLSGGQRQRLEISRAMVSDPTILILDEATSALDPVREEQIDDSLRRRGCTCIIIAHRLSTVRDCDRIFVMEKGKIVQQGTHDEMKEVDGPYKRLMGGH